MIILWWLFSVSIHLAILNRSKNSENVHHKFLEPEVFKSLVLFDQNPKDIQ